MKEENVSYGDNKKSKKKILIILAVLIVIIGAGLTGTGIFLLSKPRAVFQESYNYLTRGFKSLGLTNMESLDILDKDKIKVENKMNINLNQSLGLGITNLDLNMQVMNDKTNKISKFYLDSKLENQRLLEFVSYLKENKVYLTISDIFDKYYYSDVESSVDEALTIQDIELLSDIVKDSFKKVITDDKFEKEKTTTSVDGIEENVTRLTLKVDDKLTSDLVLEILSEIRNSDDALEIIANISYSSKDELIKSLDEFLSKKPEVTGETLFTYNIYYKNINDIKKLEILSGTTIVTYSANNGNYRFKVIDDDMEVEELSLLIEKQDDSYNVTLNSPKFKITGKLLKNKNNYNLTLDMLDNKNTNLGTIVIDYLYTSNVQDKLVITYQKDGVNYVKVTIDSNITFDETISVPDMSSAKSIDAMTEEEVNIIMTNLQNHQIIGPIISMFMQSNDDTLIGDSSNDVYSDDTTFDIYQ